MNNARRPNARGEPRQQPQRGTSGATVLFVKGLLVYEAIETSLGCQGVWCFTMAFRIVNSLRMQAVRATFAAFPAARKRS
jgi:hypothetical protein